MIRKFFTVLLLLSSTPSFAKPISVPGISRSCIACHGAGGISTVPDWPNLAGQNAKYITKQLKDFQEGRRKDPMMTPIANTLSDLDISILSTYFDRLKPNSADSTINK